MDAITRWSVSHGKSLIQGPARERGSRVDLVDVLAGSIRELSSGRYATSPTVK
jgi:hypothetical protein